MILIMKILNFLSMEGIIVRLNKNNICINVFFYENNSVYPVYVSDQERKDCMDLLLITDKISHTMCVLKFLRDLCVK